MPIYKKEMFDWVPIQDGDKSICLAHPSMSIGSNFVGKEVIWNKDRKEIEEYGSGYYPYYVDGEFVRSNNIFPKDWSHYNKQPDLKKSKIYKHFREVQPGEMDTLCSLDSKYRTIPRAIVHEDFRIFDCEPQLVMYVGKELMKPSKTICADLDFAPAPEMVHLKFIVGERLMTFCNRAYLDFAQYTSRSGPVSKSGDALFKSWLYHKDTLYVSKNRKIK